MKLTVARGYEPTEDPLLTVINYSGGRQSSALVWMMLRNEIERPKNLYVLNADPGMENSETYKYHKLIFDACDRAGIPAYTVEGPNLYKDIVDLQNTEKTRFDNPPYWTKSKNGARGRLMQKCTGVYKIAPMDREIRHILERDFGILKSNSRIGDGIVEKWIGFPKNEVLRIKPPSQRYVYFRYPLIELEMSSADVVNWYIDSKTPMPPRSVCNACFANGLDTFKQMHDERPSDWQQAVNVDKSVRNLDQIGVKDQVFVSATLESLETLAARNFDNLDSRQLSISGNSGESFSCDSGYCFL